jgi:hypothetical protein
MNNLVESPASQQPTPPGTTDALEADRKATEQNLAATTPPDGQADAFEELKGRAHPFE